MAWSVQSTSRSTGRRVLTIMATRSDLASVGMSLMPSDSRRALS